MANYENLKSAIQQVVKTNGNNAITGALLQQSLLAIINSLGAGYQFIGVATPATNPGTPDKKVFYIASTAGTYSGFGGLEVTEDEVVILTWDSSWHLVPTGITKGRDGAPGPEGPQGPKGDKMTYADLTEADKADLYEGGASLIRPLLDGKQDTISDLDDIRSNAQNASDAIASIVEAGYVFAGIATPITEPGTPDAKVFYIANGKGTYTNFGSLEVTEDDVVILYYDNTWHKVTTGIASNEKLTELEEEVMQLHQSFDSYNSAVNNYAVDKKNEIWTAFAFDAKYRLVEDKIDANFLTPTLRFCPKTYPSIFWGKKEFAFTKGTVATAQVKAQKRFVIRELSDIHFEGWLKFGDKLGTNKVTQVIELQLKKQYPANANETTISFQIPETTDYSNVATTPITNTVNNSVVGEASIVFDDYCVSEDGWFVHFSIDKDFGNFRYANLNIVYYNGNAWISANNSIYMSASLVNPVLTSTKKFAPDGYEDVSNIAYDAIIHNNVNSGNTGKPLEEPTKQLLTPVVGPHQYTVVDNKRSIDLVFRDENGIVTEQSQSLLKCVPNYYYKQFPSGKLYIQFALDFDVLQQTKGSSCGLYTSRVQIMDCRLALTPGAKIGTNNDYVNNTWQVVDVSDDARCTVRFSIDIPADGKTWSGMYQLDFLFKSTNTNDLTEATFYDFCVSDKPLIVGGDHRGAASLKFPNVVGKSLMLFGDSEHNTGECLFDTAANLGLRAYDCHYGGHSFGWGNNWLYDWKYRQYVLQTKADFYIFCASTNDAGVVNIEQLATDESVNAVRNNYPCFGDTDTQIEEKLAIYSTMSEAQKTEVFNMTSCLCAYVEQILESNPQAKIILANSPITCTGLLTGTLSASNRGQWASGQTPASARNGRAPIFAKLDECMRTVAKRYNLPVLDFLHGVGLTFNNFTEYCADGTHWSLDDQTYIDGSISALRNNHKILVREGEILTEYISGKGV